MAVTIAVLKERLSGETRVATTPETVKKYAGIGAGVVIETGRVALAGSTADLINEPRIRQAYLGI